MTEQYIEHKLQSTSNAARDFMAWNSIRAESRLRNSPHLRLIKTKWTKLTKPLIKAVEDSERLNAEDYAIRINI